MNEQQVAMLTLLRGALLTVAGLANGLRWLPPMRRLFVVYADKILRTETDRETANCT